jgi:hypothetical protein
MLIRDAIQYKDVVSSHCIRHSLLWTIADAAALLQLLAGVDWEW